MVGVRLWGFCYHKQSGGIRLHFVPLWDKIKVRLGQALAGDARPRRI